MLHGMDPKLLLEQGREDYLIHMAILQKAIEIEGRQKFDEIKLLAQTVGIETAKLIAKMFG